MAAPSLRFAPLQRLPARSSGFFARTCLIRAPAPSGFLNLLTPQPPRACRPCFRPDPLMGFSPSELCSSRAAVRRLRRLCPPGVRLDRSIPTWALTSCETKASPPSPATVCCRSAPNHPDFRALLHARVRHYYRLFTPTAARSSPGVSPFRAFPLAGMAEPSLRLPSRDWPAGSRTTFGPLLRVLLPREIGWSLSRLPALLGFPAS
jgi:hypothetical protein